MQEPRLISLILFDLDQESLSMLESAIEQIGALALTLGGDYIFRSENLPHADEIEITDDLPENLPNENEIEITDDLPTSPE